MGDCNAHMTGTLRAHMTGTLRAHMTGTLRAHMTGTLRAHMTGTLRAHMTGTLRAHMTGTLRAFLIELEDAGLHRDRTQSIALCVGPPAITATYVHYTKPVALNLSYLSTRLEVGGAPKPLCDCSGLVGLWCEEGTVCQTLPTYLLL